MKRTLLSAALISVAAVGLAQTKVTDRVTVYDLDNSRLHVYQSEDAMGDVSFIIEGENELIILEQPLFWENINEFNSYVNSLKKPIDKVVANYHSLGLAVYQPKSVVMPEAMIAFIESAPAQGMISHFKSEFGDKADFRAPKKVKGFTVPSHQEWAGVSMEFTTGSKTDFPAASILIDGKAYYTHFAPAKAHFSPLQISSPESVDTTLSELYKIKDSSAKYIFGSHGQPAIQEDVAFQIEYLEKVKSLMSECKRSDIFGQRLMVAYTSIPGAENIKPLAKALYPGEVESEDRSAVRSRVEDYLNMVSTLDMEIAKGLWAERDDISIITPKTQFFGYYDITQNFLIKTFSSLTSRKLHSLSEATNVNGDSANVQLYWVFDTVDAKGESHQTRGRESLIFEKINGEWRLVHVHYSRLM